MIVDLEKQLDAEGKGFSASRSEREQDSGNASPGSEAAGYASAQAAGPALIESVSSAGATRPRHGWKPPAIYLQQEKFEHRIVAFLKAEGRSNEEIAAVTGYSDTRVGYLVKQPWMEQFILDLIAENGGNKVEQFLLEQVMPSLELYASIRDDSEAANRDRIAAANAILDRKFGKPNQPVSVVDRKPVSEMSLEQVDARLAELQRLKSQKTN